MSETADDKLGYNSALRRLAKAALAPQSPTVETKKILKGLRQ